GGYINTKEHWNGHPNPRNHIDRSPTFSHQRAAKGSRRSAPTPGDDALAQAGNGRGCIARRAVGDDSGTRALLGDGLRLAYVRGDAERPPAIHDRDRWARHAFHPRTLEA